MNGRDPECSFSRGPVSSFAFWCALAGSLCLFLLCCWCATGTLSPYAASFHAPLVLPDCSYLANPDEYHFRGPFLMLDGAPSDQWNQSQVLRRLLHPLLSYPLMKAFGFHVGGVLTSVVLHLFAGFIFLRFLQRRFGDRACMRAAWLLSSYPGIFYWIGMPYSYAMIVPGSLLSAVIIARLDQRYSWHRALWSGLLLGVIFTGYDLFTIYGAAGVLLCLYQRRFVGALLLLVGISAPIAASLLVLTHVLNAPLANANSEIFSTILASYTSIPDFSAWGTLLQAVPRAAWNSFFFSNFLVLPIAFLVILCAHARSGVRQLFAWEWAVLAGGLCFFLFNNMAPPYEGKWQMRGDWVARLYQPIFPVFITVLARAALMPKEIRVSLAFLATVVVVNLAIVLGPLVRSPLADYVYHNFYRHAFEPFRMSQNIERYGARPLGFCRPERPADTR